MGLDMFLDRKTYVKNWSYMKPEEIHKVTVTTGGKRSPINRNRVKYITEEVMYWRKANAIHRWFVDNIQNGKDDCGTYWVDPDKLRSLLEKVREVLKDHSRAHELLPTTEGFFFGGTEYDEYYFKDLEETEKILTEALKSDHGDFEYSSSW